jgi:hypothetical protein
LKFEVGLGVDITVCKRADCFILAKFPVCGFRFQKNTTVKAVCTTATDGSDVFVFVIPVGIVAVF